MLVFISVSKFQMMESLIMTVEASDGGGVGAVEGWRSGTSLGSTP